MPVLLKVSVVSLHVFFKLGTQWSGYFLSHYIRMLNEQIVCVLVWSRRDAGVYS